MLRVFWATLLSPLWAPLYTAFFANVVFTGLPKVGADWSVLYAASINWTFGFAYGFLPMIVLAPLAHLLLSWRRRTSLLSYVSVWFLLSHILWWGYINLTPVQNDIVSALARSFLFNLPWMPAGATFWAIARPDKRVRRDGNVADFDKATLRKAVSPPGQHSQFGMRGRKPQ